ncbi:MAG: PDZ domain-containing protein [Clostridia bacterium]|nr:PDZ domain-containing protein [Clostridia bacterium]
MSDNIQPEGVTPESPVENGNAAEVTGGGQTNGGGKKVSAGVFIVSLLMVIVLTGALCFAAFTAVLARERESLGFLRKVQQLDSIYRQYYVGDLDYDAITDSLLRAYISSIDKYGYYLDARDYHQMVSELNSTTTGMGVYVTDAGYGLEIVHVMANSPAKAAGLQTGDVVYRVNGVLYTDVGYSRFLELSRGVEGNTGTVEIMRGEESLTFEITYAKYYIETVFPKVLANGVGYILIVSFDEGTASDFKAAVDELKKAGCDRFVFDLRGNGGGRIDTVTNMLDYVMGEGLITTITDSEGNVVESYYSDAKDAIEGMPCVLLVNSMTASASELFACALRDSKGALLVGVTTYGKGTMQHILSMADGTGVGITTNFFNPPKTPNFDGVGLTPDVVAYQSDEGLYYSIFTIPYEYDTQLQAAVAAVTGK